MKIKIEKNIYGEHINLVPENQKELRKLKNIWKCKLKKVGYSIHARGATKYALENSSFSIKILPV